MANNDNIIYAKFNHGREITTDSRSQYAYGQVLKISGLHLPASFDADVSNKGDKQAKAIIGTDNELPIDDAFFLSGKDVIVMIIAILVQQENSHKNQLPYLIQLWTLFFFLRVTIE